MAEIAGVSTWTELANGDNALATATHAAVTGVRHYITDVTASFSVANTTLLQVKDGTTVIWEAYAVNGQHFPFQFPLRGTAGNAVSAELAASGVATQIGRVAITGFSS